MTIIVVLCVVVLLCPPPVTRVLYMPLTFIKCQFLVKEETEAGAARGRFGGHTPNKAIKKKKIQYKQMVLGTSIA